MRATSTESGRDWVDVVNLAGGTSAVGARVALEREIETSGRSGLDPMAEQFER
jgi:phosphosulfolactate synthase (CoM biosynthesis protein A)